MNRSSLRGCSLVVAVSLACATLAHGLLPPEATGEFYVGNYFGDNVLVYGPSGNYLRSFDAGGQLTRPRGIVFVPDGRIYVAGENSNRIFVFNENEEHIDDFSYALPPFALDGPTGMALSNDGLLLYVSSFDNDRIFVFDLDGNYQRDFGHLDLDGPNCVAFDSTGSFYVSSAVNANVLKFGSDEAWIDTFTGLGALSPMSIARNTGDEFYVSGGASNNIVKFDTNGTVLNVITHPNLPGPQGIAFDDRGHFFSSSFSANTIVEFDENDAWVQTITGPELNVPRSIAFLPLEPGPVPTVSGWGLLVSTLLLLTAGTIILRHRPSRNPIEPRFS